MAKATSIISGVVSAGRISLKVVLRIMGNVKSVEMDGRIYDVVFSTLLVFFCIGWMIFCAYMGIAICAVITLYPTILMMSICISSWKYLIEWINDPK